MTGIKRASLIASKRDSIGSCSDLKVETFPNGKYVKKEEINDPTNVVRKSHHVLLCSHLASTLMHIICGILLYIAWDEMKKDCKQISTFIRNLQGILTAIYILMSILKIIIIIRHHCYTQTTAKIITVIVTILSCKQYFLAILCELILEGTTIFSTNGTCNDLRYTKTVWFSRIFYLTSIIVNSFFFAFSVHCHPREKKNTHGRPRELDDNQINRDVEKAADRGAKFGNLYKI